jgi:S-formylglutathione hydrolase FrmB
MKRLFLAILAACSSSAQAPAPKPPAAPVTPAAAPAPVAHGTFADRTFHSAALGVDKHYVVYLPAGYEGSTKRYPVFYYLHGLTGNEHGLARIAHLDEAADTLGIQAILVMPDGDDGFYADAITPVDYDACMKDGTGLFLPKLQRRDETCVRKRNYETYMTKDLLADVDATYRTIARRDGRGLAGFSMGGFGALELAMRHPDLYAAAASHSGVDALLYAGPHPYTTFDKAELVSDVSTWGRTGDPQVNAIGVWVRGIFGPDKANWLAHDPAALAAKLAPGQLALYLDAGTEDVFGLDAEAAYLHDILNAHHIEHEFFIGPGGHDFGFWLPRVPKSLAFLRDHLAKPQ